MAILMDSIFLLEEGDRATFLQHIMEAFNCTYICLWSYSYFPQPSNCLFCLDGIYNDRANQPTTSSGTSLARRLFDDYRRVVFNVDIGVPGLAFKSRLPFVELKSADLQRLASAEAQRQYYQEAGIKIAVFMGCTTGEIEFGISNEPQINLEMELKQLFPEDFSRQVVTTEELPIQTEQTRASSSSSSLRSLSVDSSEYSSLLFNIPSSAYMPQPGKEAVNIERTMGSSVPPLSTPTSPTQQTIQALTQLRNIQFPSLESEHAALTKAMLAVISSSSSSSTRQSEQNLPPNYQVPQRSPAFRQYRSTALPPRLPEASTATRRATMFKRAITFYRTLSLMRRQEQAQGSRPTTTQLHHMFSERRRREKLNESFQALRSLLPPGTKKDKASLLATTTEYLTSLKDQVAELSKRNQILEAQLLPRQEEAKEQQAAGDSTASSSSTQRVQVRITDVAASTSMARLVDLQVAVRGQCSMLDLVICILEFLKNKHANNVSVVSIDANTMVEESSSVNRVMLRLRIEEDGWDKAAFQEAVKRIVDDLAQ